MVLEGLRPNASWHWFITTHLMLDAAIGMIAGWSAASIARTGSFKIVLTGGNTVRPLYERMRRMKTSWPDWHVYWGDERCVTVGDAARNSGMALDSWISHVPIPPQQVHQIPAETGGEAAAAHYRQILEEAGVFDLVLLSLGSDGHVASLFPGQALGDNPDAPAVQAVWAPQSVQSPARVSLAAWRLSATKHMLIFAAGHGKGRAVGAWRGGQDVPAASLSALDGIDVLVADIPDLEFA